MNYPLDLNALTPDARNFVNAIAGRSDLPECLARMALVFRAKKQTADAKQLAQAAIALSPSDLRIRVMTEWLNRHQAPLWHFGIIHDQLRNETYANALRHFVKPGMIVFEIGTGTGILAMLAAQAGAQHVYTCERRPDVAEAAQAIIERNGFADRISVIAKDAYEVRLGVDIPTRADLFVAEIVDSTLLGEGVLPLTELAREKFLTPDAVLLPSAVSAVGCLIGGAGYRHQYRMDQVMGFDLTPFNRFTPLQLNAANSSGYVDSLSEPVELANFDLHANAPNEATKRISLTANIAGRVECLLRWLKLDFGAGIVFENHPPLQSAWHRQLHTLPEPRWLNVGDTLNFEISHNRERLFIIPL